MSQYPERKDRLSQNGDQDRILAAALLGTELSPRPQSPLYKESFISIKQIENLNYINDLFYLTTEMRRIVETVGGIDVLNHRYLLEVFYEPSSRTYASFATAMLRLGGEVVPLQGVNYSSVIKGETFEDTVQTFASYGDILVIRHPEVGAAARAAAVSQKPVINAGDGVGEHPSQALLDLYTIKEHFDNINGLTVTMAGDLLNGRTIHSLAELLSLYKGITINTVSPEVLSLTPEMHDMLTAKGLTIRPKETIEEALVDSDVLYMTRVQGERFTDKALYEKLKNHFIVTEETMRYAKENMILMHPLPRVGEIATAVDKDPRSVYLREQMRNGMYVRMALLYSILKG